VTGPTFRGVPFLPVAGVTVLTLALEAVEASVYGLLPRTGPPVSYLAIGLPLTWLLLRPGKVVAVVLGLVETAAAVVFGALLAWFALEQVMGWSIAVMPGGWDPLAPDLRLLAAHCALHLLALALLVRGWRRFRREEAERAQAGRVADF